MKHRHRLMIMMEVETELPLDDIKGVIENDLNGLLEDEEHEGSVDVFSDATSHGIDNVTAVIEVAGLVDQCITNLRSMCERAGSIELFGEGIGQIEHGITDLRASARTIASAGKTMRRNIPRILEMMGGQTMTAAPPREIVAHAPMEALHAIAHSMGLESCDGMERADYIRFIHGKMDEHESQRRKDAN